MGLSNTTVAENSAVGTVVGLFTAADVLNVKLPNQIRPLDIQLVDVNGQVAYECKAVTSDKLSIDVSGYRSGVYLVLLTSGSKVAKWRVAIK